MTQQSTSLTTTRWWWVRHAPVVVNKGRIYGQIDHSADCTQTPIFRWLGQELPQAACLYTSNLLRTHQTAATIIENGGGEYWGEPVREDAFVEQHFGDWQGQTHDQVVEWPDNVGENFWLAPSMNRAPNGESFADVVARVAPAIHRINSLRAGQDIVCAAHYGTIMAALCVAMGGSLDHAMRFRINNLSITRIDCFETHNDAGPNRREWGIMRVNHTAPEGS